MVQDLTTTVDGLCRAIDLRTLPIAQADSYYAGTQPLAYLSPLQRKALGDRYQSLAANYVRLATDSVAERLAVTGFTRGGESLAVVWADWQGCGMEALHRVAILESLIIGQSFVTVWGDGEGPVISVDSPREMAVQRHPLTRRVVRALKRWRDADGTARAVLFEADKIRTFKGPHVPEGGALPSTGWAVTEVIPNPLGVCPVVALTNSDRLHDQHGTPEASGIWDLTDGLAKLLSDTMVGSEATALPRRWVTGLAVDVDENGNVIPPFDLSPESVWQAEPPDAKFGSFSEPNMAAYQSLIEVLIRQIGAISGLPDHLIGIAGVDPSSAEQIRAASESLVGRAYSAQRRFGQPLAQVAALVEAVRTGGRVATDIQTVWRSPEATTRAADADAAAKLVQAQIWPVERAWVELGATPEEITELRGMRVRAALDAEPLTLPGVAQ